MEQSKLLIWGSARMSPAEAHFGKSACQPNLTQVSARTVNLLSARSLTIHLNPARLNPLSRCGRPFHCATRT